MVQAAEEHGEWLVGLSGHMRDNGETRIDAEVTAEDEWVQHVHDIAEFTLFPRANSWYVGANIPGKPRVFMPYIGGLPAYIQRSAPVVKGERTGSALLCVDGPPPSW